MTSARRDSLLKRAAASGRGAGSVALTGSILGGLMVSKACFNFSVPCVCEITVRNSH